MDVDDPAIPSGKKVGRNDPHESRQRDKVYAGGIQDLLQIVPIGRPQRLGVERFDRNALGPGDLQAVGVGLVAGHQRNLEAAVLGARGIDQFIGVADMVGRGHGSAFIRAFVDGLLAAGVPRVITDPSIANARAIRACVKAGFHGDREVDTPDERALVMMRDNSIAG